MWDFLGGLLGGGGMGGAGGFGGFGGLLGANMPQQPLQGTPAPDGTPLPPSRPEEFGHQPPPGIDWAGMMKPADMSKGERQIMALGSQMMATPQQQASRPMHNWASNVQPMQIPMMRPRR